MNDNTRDMLAFALRNVEEAAEIVRWILNAVPPSAWAFPVGTVMSSQYPPERWYAACVHDLTGKANGGYAHTGIDLNLDVNPWGDVDRSMPVWAVANGMVYAAGYSTSYLGSVIVQCEHDGKSLWIRYWHLADDAAFRAWKPGNLVTAGICIGHIGDYKLGEGGDHLHLDMRDKPFEAHWWFTSHAGGWLDPVPILKAHLDPALVDAMLRRGA